MIDVALSYLDLGWSIIPLKPHDKVPHFALLPKDEAGKATWAPFQENPPARDQVAEWWTRAPEANVGIVTGEVSGIIVQDLDGPEGLSTAHRNGIPVTPTSRTGHGLHLIYRHPGHEVPNSSKRLPGVDVRGDGGYIVAPPSVHPSGAVYQWQVTPDTALADAPDWFYAALDNSEWDWLQETLRSEARSISTPTGGYWEKALANELQRLSTAVIGNRNNSLVQSAYRMGQIVAAGHLDEGEVEGKLYLVARAIGLDEGETRRTIQSGLRAGMLNPRR